MSKENELVLCIDNHGIDGVWTGNWNPPEVYDFIRRGDAENDPSKRQIIPYLIVRACHNYGDYILTYRRGTGGGEERLHDLYSYGVGGHINKEDTNGTEDFMEIVTNCIEREIFEELGLSIKDDFHKVTRVGIISLNESAVDKVHLGIVFILDIVADSINKLNIEADALADMQFKTIRELESLNLENWSKAFLPELKRLV